MKRLSLLMCSLLLSVNSFAADLTVTDAYIRATPPHTANSAAYLRLLNNTDKDIKLISVESDLSERVELHNHINENGMMKMRQVDSILIEGNGFVDLEPGGYHIMFLGLRGDLLEGQIIKLTLNFENSESMSFYTAVKKINTAHSN
ncbi:copper chaperone PCu(A)C [Psychromonas sp.]|nr:copper chaperone PCu(A)C [Psychromonas sp.]